MNSFNSKTFKNLLYLYLPLMYVAIGTMISIYAERVPYRDWVRLIMAVIGIFLLYIDWNRSSDRFGVFKVIVPFSILILITTFSYYFLESSLAGAHSVLNLGDSVLWISVMYLSYKTALNSENALGNARYIAITIPIYFVIFTSVRMYFLLNTDDRAMISTAYYALFLLPFAMLIKRKWLKWLLVIFIFFTILLSSKRAGFIAFIGSLIIYFLNILNGKNITTSKRLGYFLSFGLIILIGYVIFDRFTAANDLNILDRMSRISEDGGSGRDVIWKYSWELVWQSDFISLLFGHGFDTVIHASVLGVSSHTDFIEVVYDYGIIGSIMYILFYVKLLKYYRYVKKFLPEYSASFAVSLFLTFVLSAFAHLIIYPTHFLFVCMFWGLIIGECNKRIINNGQFN